MGFFRSLSTNKTNEPDDYSRRMFEQLVSYMGSDGQTYTSIKAINNSDVFTAIHTIASDIASTPIIVMKDGIEDPLSELSILLNYRPNSYMSGYFLKYVVVLNMLLNKDSYCEIKKTTNGTPVELHFIRNSEMSLEQGTKNNLIYIHKPKDGNERKIPAANILHYKISSLDGLTGRSPLESLTSEIEVQEEGKNLVKDFFKYGSKPSGILKLKKANVAEDARKKTGENFEQDYTGAKNNQRVMVLDELMEFTPIEINTDVLEIVNNYTFTTKQVAKVFGLPLNKLGIETVNTSLSQANLDYLTNTLTNYFAALLSELNFKLYDFSKSKEYRIAFDTKRFRESDAETKAKTVISLFQNGLLSHEQALAEYGYKFNENERYFISLNYADMNVVNDIQMNKLKNHPTLGGGGDNEK